MLSFFIKKFTLCLPFFCGITTSTQAENFSLKVLTYNVWGLPVNFPQYDQDYRFSHLPKDISQQNADILCFQETFAQRIRIQLTQQLRNSYQIATNHACQSITAGGLLRKDCHGGLMTFSKFPVCSEQFFPYPTFPKASFVEKMGAKGFLLSCLETPLGEILVVNTHLYAGLNARAEAQRLLQLNYLQAVVQNYLDAETAFFFNW